MEWMRLNYNKKHIIDDVLSKWEKLISENHKEHVYHQFLKDHAGLFFDNDNSYLAISKLKLGSELETDFILLSDGFSNGNHFELIEIEKPSSQLFTKEGLPSKDLNSSMQQIRDWKRWLIDNKGFFKRHLPTRSMRVLSKSFLSFTIIIGRRTENNIELDKREQLADDLGAKIRSFDPSSARLI